MSNITNSPNNEQTPLHATINNNVIVAGDKTSTINQLQKSFENTLNGDNVTNSPINNIQSKSGLTIKDIDNVNNKKHWPFGIVPYVFSPELTPDEISIMRAGMEMISSQTNVTFIELPDNNNDGIADGGPKDYVKFARSDKAGISDSYVGMIGGAQNINISTSAGSGSSVAHEIMHALGFKHAHQHPDSKNIVKVNMDNIKPSFHKHYAIYNNGTIVGPYDPESIMHYGQYSGDNGNGPTMELKEGATITLSEGGDVGHRENLSSGDIAAINKVYPANENNKANGFDGEYYLARYPDVAASVGKNNYRGAYIHWHQYGMAEGRSPVPS